MSTDYSTQQGGHDGNTTHERGLLTVTKPLKKPEPAKDCPSPGEEAAFLVMQERRIEEAKNRAASIVRGNYQSAQVAETFGRSVFAETPLYDVALSIKHAGDAVAAGDMSGIEHILTGQIVALNNMFADCAMRAQENLGGYLNAAETYMRVALRAQSQCTRTAEVLGNLRAGPTIFAKQANVTTGPQQVNNHASPPARAQEPKKSADELLKDATHEQQWMDTGAQAAPTRGNPAVEAVGAVDGAEIGKGQSRFRRQ